MAQQSSGTQTGPTLAHNTMTDGGTVTETTIDTGRLRIEIERETGIGTAVDRTQCKDEVITIQSDHLSEKPQLAFAKKMTRPGEAGQGNAQMTATA